MNKLTITFLIFLFAAQSCAFGFSFRKKTPEPLNVKEKMEYVNIDFFKRFNDPYLIKYVCDAVTNNHDAKKASWQVEQFRQEARYSLGHELPSLSVSAEYLGIKIPRLDNFNLQQNAFILPFVASYEPDFLLKNRDKTRSTKKSYEAKKYEEKSVYISLAADTTCAYINVIQYDALINYQKQLLEVKNKELARQYKKYSRGVIDNETLNSAKQGVKQAQNDLNTLEKQRNLMLTRLAILTGKSPEQVGGFERGTFENFDYYGKIPDEISSDVTFSRPDLMAAESKLEKAKIDIRVARKEFFPTFNLNGIWVFNTLAPGSFFSWESSLAAILAGATQDIFKGGMKIANLRINQAKYQQMFENYQQTDLNALKEVNDALFIIKTDTNVDLNTIEKLKIQKSDYLNNKDKYDRGVISYPEFLDEQDKLINSKQNQIKSKTARIVNYLTLYKAAGGKI